MFAFSVISKIYGQYFCNFRKIARNILFKQNIYRFAEEFIGLFIFNDLPIEYKISRDTFDYRASFIDANLYVWNNSWNFAWFIRLSVHAVDNFTIVDSSSICLYIRYSSIFDLFDEKLGSH